MSLSSMRGDKIEIQKPLAREQSGPSVLRVMDPYQRVFFFSLDLCKTWFVSYISTIISKTLGVNKN